MNPDSKTLYFKIRPFFKWFDLWIGVFIDTQGQTIYVCPLPALGLKISWWYETQSDKDFRRGWQQAADYARELAKLDGDAQKAIERTRSLLDRD